MPPRFIAEQLSHPSGFFAPIISFLMNRHNARMNRFAMSCLDLKPTDRLLEVGFGGGLTLRSFIANAGYYVGLDRSAAVCERASKRFSDEVLADRASFHQGKIEEMPFAAESFDKFFTVNTIYFWSDLSICCEEIRRVLVPGGRATIGFLPKEHMQRMKMPQDIFTMRDPDDICTAMTQAGFIGIDIHRPDPQTLWNVVVATRR